ncbi:apolipoprotein N-acyltransferase [Paludibaculum fermentans]|uniref:Apolipoprotein N-acyltransferase n=1 Tax=Paludibaculum fermentans TaxID=1473598 RepID=A0A7S7SM88_PALFE|nr:apolipoprotein N-acyltransferase [Paludibaculum fermentans]QOY89256.1 apolipoprotein N-acyltransferase [Paludibaculum fermentans]
MYRWQLSLAGSILTAVFLIVLFPPFQIPLLAPVALTPLLYALAQEPDGKHRFLWGWLCGFLYWVIVCHWIRDVLAAYGGLTGPLSWLAVVLFAAAKGLHMAVFAWLAGFVLNRSWAIPAVAALWTGIERTHGTLGFAWLTLGNAGIEMAAPLRAAPVFGVYGLSFIFALLAAGLTMVALRRDRRQLAWLLPLVLLYILPIAGPTKAPDAQAAAIQTNIGADVKWTAEEKERVVKRLSLLTLQESLDVSKPKPNLVLWPEAPAPFYYYDDAAFREQVTGAARLAGAPLLFTGVAYSAQKEPLNSAILLGPEGQLLGRYDKVNLVPFGEYIPAGFGWIQKISSEAGNYAPGPGPKVFITEGHTLGAFICYESAFPSYIREFARSGAEVLINLTNDGYFGRGIARQQHLQLVRMRAVENQRWVLRPANDGITASIDPAGRIWDRLPEFKLTSGRLRFGWNRTKTLYTEYGDWFAWLCLAAGLAGVVYTQLPTYRPAE